MPLREPLGRCYSGAPLMRPGSYASWLILLAAGLGLAATTILLLPCYSDSFAAVH